MGWSSQVVIASEVIVEVSATEYIRLFVAPAPISGPVIAMNSDSASFDQDGIIEAVTVGAPTRGVMVLSSPYASAGSGVPGTIELYAGDPAGTALATIFAAASDVIANGFAFQNSADISVLVTANTPTIAPGTSQIVASVTIVAPPSAVGPGQRSFEVCAHWHGVNFQTPSATIGTNRISMSVQSNGVGIAGERILGQGTSIAQCGGTISVVDTPAAGSVTYDLVMSHEASSLAATANVNASATSPAFIYVKGFA